MTAHSFKLATTLAAALAAHAALSSAASAQEAPPADSPAGVEPTPTAQVAPAASSLGESTLPPIASVDAPATVARMGRMGAQLDLLPIGTLSFEGEGDSVSQSTDTGFAIGGFVDWAVTPGISIGLAPRLVLSVKGKGAEDSAKMLDLRARALAHMPLSPLVEGYGFVSPGYSWMILPEGDETPAGFVLGFGAGLAIDVGPEVFAVGEVSYQLGFHGGSVGGQDYTLSVDYLSISFGLGKNF